ncbi:hypothetical protein ACFL08_01945 [Patescibacteria group bacterium]
MKNVFEKPVNNQERDRSYLVKDYFGNESNFKNEVVVRIMECTEDSRSLDEKRLLKDLMVATEYSQLSVEEKGYLEEKIMAIKIERKKRDEIWDQEAERAGYSDADEYRKFLKGNE